MQGVERQGSGLRVADAPQYGRFNSCFELVLYYNAMNIYVKYVYIHIQTSIIYIYIYICSDINMIG